MKRIFLSLLFAGAIWITDLHAQNQTQYVQITTVESVVGGGAGRSKMIITKEDGSQEEKDMENLFSIAGINFKNIRQNETTILQTLKTYTDSGWKLFSTTPLTLSPSNNGNGIFMTRYLLVKEEAKK
jgi:hypothetical protein